MSSGGARLAGSMRAIALAGAVAITLAGCGGGDAGDEEAAGPAIGDPGPVHVHGLGVNPSDGALFIATHTGLFRAPQGQTRATRVAGRYQDTMGFTVVGPDRFLGSGHPDGREDLPPFLGLIESVDAGETWRPVSLLGERDFHVLEASDERVYGFGADFQTQKQALLVSNDGGETWTERDPPEPLLSLAIHPEDPDHVVASGERGVLASRRAGARWSELGGDPGLLAWPAAGRLYLVDARGVAHVSDDAGESWGTAGEVGGEPAALDAGPAEDLYVALHDGTVKRSTDGGETWRVRSAP